MNIEIEVLKSILGGFFKEQIYSKAIEELREALVERIYYKDNWEGVVKLVLMRNLPEGQALFMMDNDANLMLHENSDSEAFKWLTLMIINASKPRGGIIWDYKNFVDPEKIIPAV